MTRQGCPFCGNIHINIVVRELKYTHQGYAECRRCKARGPVAEEVVAFQRTVTLQNEVSARWDERR